MWRAPRHRWVPSQTLPRRPTRRRSRRRSPTLLWIRLPRPMEPTSWCSSCTRRRARLRQGAQMNGLVASPNSPPGGVNTTTTTPDWWSVSRFAQNSSRRDVATDLGRQPRTTTAIIHSMRTMTVDDLTYEQVAKTIDHSLLRPELTLDDVRDGCALAARYDVASACVRAADVVLAAEMLAGTGVAVGTVIGFPHGAHLTSTKVHEAQQALEGGATELDMVINIGWLRSGEDQWVEDDIRAVVEAAAGRAIVKVILENAYLTKDEIVRGCRVAEAAGADFVKTSTGFAPGGVTLEDIRLMRATVSPRVRVKAAGGVRSLDALLDVMAAGADRCGATRTAEMLDEFRTRKAGGTPVATAATSDPRY